MTTCEKCGGYTDAFDPSLIAGRLCSCRMTYSSSGTVMETHPAPPPPLTPKDSLSVEVEEIRKHHENWVISRFIPLYGLKMVGRLLDMVDDGQEENLKLCLIIAALPDASRYKKLLDQLEAAQAQLRRKDEALEFYADPRSWEPIALPGNRHAEIWITDKIKQDAGSMARAALADGKEGGR